ncbi:MAG: DNA topoisomerase 3 [Flavobacteriales bacterium]
MKLCIAEKPSVAREIAEVIGAKEKKIGYYEGNGYQVTWTFGHFCTLKEPHEYNPSWKPWNLSYLPILPPAYEIKLIDNKGVKEQFRIIKYLVGSCSKVINCGDAGQEGELIQRWVLEHAGNTKPIDRLWISSLTNEAIREGFSKLQEGTKFDRLYHAGKSRAIGDWVLGFNATRLYTLRYGNGKQVLSIGRVQTPTLAMIVNRQKEIEDFKPSPYWMLQTKYRNTVFNAEAGKFIQVAKAKQQLDLMSGSDFEVVSNQTKEGKESPLRLFDLTSLQVTCNSRFNLSAEDTLKVIQSLYEKKLCSYPRVDTTFLPNDVYPKIEGILRGLKVYAAITSPLLGKPIRKSTKVFNDKKVTDHHAIIPTGQNPSSGLSYNEKMVFDLISKRFIAAFYPDCIVSNTTVRGQANTVTFKANGKQILDFGWRNVYGKDSTSATEEVIMPDFKVGEKGAHEPVLDEKSTKAPPWLTEGTLLRAMETAGKHVEDEEARDLMKENGIGRPSTRAAVIETLFRRKYIVKQKKKLVATPMGVQLIDTIQNELLKSPKLTGQWEKKLRDIEQGTYDYKVFLKEMESLVATVVKDVKNRQSVHRFSLADVKVKKKVAQIVCPKCQQGSLLKGNNAFGCSDYKNGCHLVFPFAQFGKKLTENQLNQLITKKKTNYSKGFVNEANKVEARLVLTDDFSVVLELKEQASLLCPNCKTGTILKGKTAFGCSRYQQGCKTLVPFEYAGKKLSEAQCMQLLGKGETSLINDFVQNGIKIDAKLKFDAQFNICLV